MDVGNIVMLLLLLLLLRPARDQRLAKLNGAGFEKVERKRLA